MDWISKNHTISTCRAYGSPGGFSYGTVLYFLPLCDVCPAGGSDTKAPGIFLLFTARAQMDGAAGLQLCPGPAAGCCGGMRGGLAAGTGGVQQGVLPICRRQKRGADPVIYLDNGATSLRKPPAVAAAVRSALHRCANPGRGGHRAAMEAAKAVYRCRERAGELFDCSPEQVVCTGSCTHGLNMAIRTLVKPGSRVVISGFEHNAVTRPLHALGAKLTVAGRKLFDWQDTLESFEKALRQGQNLAVFTMASNVFGYILPIEELSNLCRTYGVPFVVDAAQGAGILPISMERLQADFIAMPGHKGLLGPQGTGILLCRESPKPLLYGGTGSMSREQSMPDFLPDVGEAGTVNVPGIAGLRAGIQTVRARGLENIFAKGRLLNVYFIIIMVRYFSSRIFSNADV